MPAFKPIIERFWSKVRKESNGGCWEWTGAKTGDGYGSLAISRGGGRSIKAHRYSWQIHNGPIPGRLHVLHRCDVPWCVNPEHLFLGTHADNMRDMSLKGRTVQRQQDGESNAMAKLTNKDIYRIRRFLKLGIQQKKIAAKFDVSKATICMIAKGKRWASL